MKKRIYLAGPEVFLPDSIEIGRRKRELCERHGFTGHYPLDNMVRDEGHGIPLSRKIFDANIELMKSCDFAIANLTPFRGPSADAGTVFEVGFLHGLGKAVFGYANVSGDYLGRTLSSVGGTETASGYLDRDGLDIEDFGLPDNLMVIHALAGYAMPEADRKSSCKDMWRDLKQFEACLRMAAHFSLSAKMG